MTTDVTTVSAHIRMTHLDPADGPLNATFLYRDDDPYAVTAVFGDGADARHWKFARDLLTEGLEVPAGIGDVHVTPLDGCSGDTTLITIRSPDGQATLAGDTAQIRGFLDRTYQAVPMGTEQLPDFAVFPEDAA